MRHFKLVQGGSHTENGKSYRRGQIVPSEHDLSKIWPDKFKAVDPVRAVSPEKDAALTPLREDPPADADVASDPVNDEAGSLDEDGLISLEELSAIKSDLGTNVTHKFEDIAEEGLLVFQRGSRFSVALPEEPDEALNDKLLTKKRLVEFVSTLE